MEDFSQVFYIEQKTSKGWEVLSTFNTSEGATDAFNKLLASDFGVYRLTSPTDTSIYEFHAKI